MIEPKNGVPGVIGQQHGLTRLTETLEAIQRGQRAAEQRDSQIREQLTTQAQALRQLTRQVSWLRSMLIGTAALAVLLTGLVGWHLMHPPTERFSAPFGALDSAIVSQWERLPKPVQEALSATYGRIGLANPGQRK